jgi:NAD dependent epimerase/dehydratase family enzyme
MESAFAEVLGPDQRGVVLRTNFVIGRDRGAGAGAMGTLRRLVRLGLGGRTGSDRQGMGWIHEADMKALFVRGLTDPTMTGAYIASSPNPVPQAEFMRTLRRSLGVRVGLPATATMVRIGARLLMRTDPDLALYGRYVVSERLRDKASSSGSPSCAMP